MKRRRPDIDRAMHVGRFAKVDVTELPLDLGSSGVDCLDAQIRVGERNHDIVSAVNMPQGRVAGGHRHIENADEFIFKFWMMARLAAKFDWRVSGSGRLLRKSTAGGETEREQCAQCDKLISFSHDRLLCHSIVCFKVAREAGGSVKAGASAPGERLNRVPSPWNGRQRYGTASSSERDKGGRYGMKSDRREN